MNRVPDRESYHMKKGFHLFQRFGYRRKQVRAAVLWLALLLCLLFDNTLIRAAAAGTEGDRGRISVSIDKISYTGSGNSASIASTEYKFNDVFTNEFTVYSTVRYISSENSAAGRLAGSRTASDRNSVV